MKTEYEKGKAASVVNGKPRISVADNSPNIEGDVELDFGTYTGTKPEQTAPKVEEPVGQLYSSALAEEVLGVKLRPFEETVADMARACLALEIAGPMSAPGSMMLTWREKYS